MSANTKDIIEFLGRLSDSVSPPDPAPDCLSTVQVLKSVADALQHQPLDKFRTEIEAVCRKVHVARRVDAQYGKGWKKLKDREDLEASAWPLLIGVLLASSDSEFWQNPEAKGLALKCLNSGLAALELAREAGSPSMGELEDLAAHRLAEVREALDA